MVVRPGLCGTWSETLKTGFLATRLIYSQFRGRPSTLLLNVIEFVITKNKKKHTKMNFFFFFRDKNNIEELKVYFFVSFKNEWINQ